MVVEVSVGSLLLCLLQSQAVVGFVGIYLYLSIYSNSSFIESGYGVAAPAELER
jgi:hypothetical protein